MTPSTDSLDDQWSFLQRQLDFASEPWLGFLFVRSSAALLWLRRQALAHQQAKGRPVHVEHAASPPAVLGLLAGILDTPREHPVWLELLRQDLPVPNGAWSTAREQLLLRANERREALLRAARGGLLLALPFAEKSRVRDAAPDLWSMRALVLDLVDRDAWQRQPETFRMPYLAPRLLPLQRSWMLRRLHRIGVHELVEDEVHGPSRLDRSVAVSYPLEHTTSPDFTPSGEDTDGAVLAERGEYERSFQVLLHRERNAADPLAHWIACVERATLEDEIHPAPEPLRVPWSPGATLPIFERRMAIARRILDAQKNLLDGDLFSHLATAFELEPELTFELALECLMLAAAPLAGNDRGVVAALRLGYVLKVRGLSDIPEDLDRWLTCRLQSLELAHSCLGHQEAPPLEALRTLVASTPSLPPHRRRVVAEYTSALEVALQVAEANRLEDAARRIHEGMTALGIGGRPAPTSDHLGTPRET
jgi:hypothetical protein